MDSPICSISAQLTILIITSIFTLIVFLLRDYFSHKKEEKRIVQKSKIQLKLFSKSLIASIMHENTDSLAFEHYKILISNLLEISNNKNLYISYNELENIYRSLKIGNLRDEKSRGDAVAKIEDIIKKIDKVKL